jgi:hypothetical protein
MQKRILPSAVLLLTLFFQNGFSPGMLESLAASGTGSRTCGTLATSKDPTLCSHRSGEGIQQGTESTASGSPDAGSGSPDTNAPIPLTRHKNSRNGPDALDAYRHSWNPLTAGPNFIPPPDTVPEGEFNGRFFFYSAFTEAQYTDSGGITGLPQGFSKTQLLTLAALYYGVDSNTEIILFPSILTTFSSYEGSFTNGAGLNDTTLGVKHRWVIQDPFSLRPTFSTGFLVTLPTSSWFNTPLPKGSGSLPPISVVPSTHLGEPALTAVFLLRKNIEPVRLFGAFFYSFSFPGSGVLPGATQSTFNQFGDIAQYRFAMEDVIDDRRGLGWILEFVGLSGLPFSIDGNTVNASPSSFNIFDVQPAFEINLTPTLALSAGVLLPVFGTNEFLTVTPNISLWYYWGGANGNTLPR